MGTYYEFELPRQNSGVSSDDCFGKEKAASQEESSATRPLVLLELSIDAINSCSLRAIFYFICSSAAFLFFFFFNFSNSLTSFISV
jgi:hypothetical protein